MNPKVKTLELQVATPEEVRTGKVTDVYFERSHRILEAKGVRKRVRAEFIVKSVPWPWTVFAGLEECAALLQGRPVNVRAVAEGTVFYPGQPVLEVEGVYNDFGVLETALLGCLCQASAVATKAARCKKAAGERLVVSFGARRVHPTLAPMIERNAYVGGCDGVAVVKSSELIGLPPTGTIPHALVILMGGVVDAVRAFDEVIPSDVKRVALVDTFGDEKFEALAAAEALGDRLFAVRLDTPGSRRGDFRQILREVRWELDRAGHSNVKIFVSGGIDEHQIAFLNEVADGYGVGTSISSAGSVDFAMDIVEVEGKAISKRGKLSGAKRLLRCRDCAADLLIPSDRPWGLCERCGGAMEELLVPFLAEGELLRELPSAHQVREFVLSQLARLELDLSR
ncbi:MAG: nicotinate phosphoribosyltransferase [Nitrospinota bacterium]